MTNILTYISGLSTGYFLAKYYFYKNTDAFADRVAKRIKKEGIKIVSQDNWNKMMDKKGIVEQ